MKALFEVAQNDSITNEMLEKITEDAIDYSLTAEQINNYGTYVDRGDSLKEALEKVGAGKQPTAHAYDSTIDER
jgi:hypothetical protein